MEKKVYLWAALIIGVPVLRLVEIFSVAYVSGIGRGPGFIGHIGLGLVIGIGCAMASHVFRLTDRRVLWAMPLVAMAYASLLLFLSYPVSFFRQDMTFVSSLIVMDLGSWAVAVFGASFVGYVISRPSVRPGLPIQNLGHS